MSASLGPRLDEATDEGRVAFIPPDRSVQINGVDAESESMPPGVVTAAGRVVELVWPELSGSTTKSRANGARR